MMEAEQCDTTRNPILLLEAYYGGSHKQLMDVLHDEIGGTDLFTLPAKKWHWRARTAAFCMKQFIPLKHNYRVLFTSSVLNLAELVALRPDLSCTKKILYFHENQLIYPVRKQQDRDFQYGYNQILSCLVADVVLFNSSYNMESFLSSIKSFLKLIPDYRPKYVADEIRPKCQVLYFPVKFPERTGMNPISLEHLTGNISSSVQMQAGKVNPDISSRNRLDPDVTPTETSANKCGSNSGDILPETTEISCTKKKNANIDQVQSDSCQRSRNIFRSTELHIVWPHRWEHDKDPVTFFNVLYQLDKEDLDFKVSVLGETFTDVPEVFSEAKVRLEKHIVNWGYQESKTDYYKILEAADVVVSTAKHEFFGVAMLEAVSLGCYPVCPNNLVYPEIFPKCCLYNTENQLLKQLRSWCRKPQYIHTHFPKINCEKFSWISLGSNYRSIMKYKDPSENFMLVV